MSSPVVERHALYPATPPFRDELVDVGDGHRLYVEHIGTPEGRTAVYLHGGPAAGIAGIHRRLFDPARYHAVLFDQRGAGRSQPFGALEANTTAHLVADIEALRESFHIPRWCVVGGSWGAGLALAYAEAYPHAVDALVLRGTFLGRPEDINWIYGGAAGAMFPDAWHAFTASMPDGCRPIDWTLAQLHGTDPQARRRAAIACKRWTATIARKGPPDHHAALPVLSDIEADRLVAETRLKLTYFSRGCFLDAPWQLLDRAAALTDIPGVIVHGHEDMTCRLSGALDLHRAWPRARLVVVEGAGHPLEDPGISDAIVAALDGLVA